MCRSGSTLRTLPPCTAYSPSPACLAPLNPRRLPRLVSRRRRLELQVPHHMARCNLRGPRNWHRTLLLQAEARHHFWIPQASIRSFGYGSMENVASCNVLLFRGRRSCLRPPVPSKGYLEVLRTLLSEKGCR